MGARARRGDAPPNPTADKNPQAAQNIPPKTTTTSTAPSPSPIRSVGCVLGELLRHAPLFPAQSEAECLGMIVALLGAPTPREWPVSERGRLRPEIKGKGARRGFREHGTRSFAQASPSFCPTTLQHHNTPPNHRRLNLKQGMVDLPHAAMLRAAPAPPHAGGGAGLRRAFPRLGPAGLDLLGGLLTYDPRRRLTAREALDHPYFRERPLPKRPVDMPTFPSTHEPGFKGALEARGGGAGGGGGGAGGGGGGGSPRGGWGEEGRGGGARRDGKRPRPPGL